MKIKKNGKVVNLTESDLKRIVKRVLTEQTNGDKIFKEVKYLIANAGITNWWNKSKILDTLKKIKTCDEYNGLLTLVNKESGDDDISVWIISKLKTTEYDKDQAGYITNPLRKLGTGLTDEEFNDEVRKISVKMSKQCI